MTAWLMAAAWCIGASAGHVTRKIMTSLNFSSIRKLMQVYLAAPENQPGAGSFAQRQRAGGAFGEPTASGNMCIAYYIFAKNLMAHSGRRLLRVAMLCLCCVATDSVCPSGSFAVIPGEDVKYSPQFTDLIRSDTFSQTHQRYQGCGESDCLLE